MTGGVTRDSKSAEKRKYKAKEELGSSMGCGVIIWSVASALYQMQMFITLDMGMHRKLKKA